MRHSGPVMRRRSLLLVAALALCAGSLTAALTTTCGGVYADVDGDTVVLGNRFVHRTWSRAAFGTTEMVDERTGLRLGASADFALELADGTVALEPRHDRHRRAGDGSWSPTASR